jgi:SAM-dependent methyltransferase
MSGVDRKKSQEAGDRPHGIYYTSGYWNNILLREFHHRTLGKGPVKGFLELLRDAVRGLETTLRQRFVYHTFTIGMQRIPYLPLRVAFLGGDPQLGRLRRLFNNISKLSGERAVEIPFALWFLKGHDHKSFLEVGDVLANYVHLGGRDVVDKYETRMGVTPVDIVEFKTDDAYDVILSISTVEHVGWDEPSGDPQRAVRALKRLVELLKSDGWLLVSFPVHYNPALEKFVANNWGRFNQIRFYSQGPRRGEWAEIAPELSQHKSDAVAIITTQKRDAVVLEYAE